MLILEIIGARLIAPYFGTSTYVWTAMIGVILGSLSVGYWVGGKAADKDNPRNDIALILLASSVLVAMSVLLHEPVLDLISRGNLDLRISALLAALVLFSIPSALIGSISPHLAKIRLSSLKTSGETIGRLEASGAIGSIFGVFLSGYFLLSYFGSRDISFFLAIVLLLTSFIANTRWILAPRLILLGILCIILFASGKPADNVLLDKDTAYTRYRVFQEVFDGKQVNTLRIDETAIQSAYQPSNPYEPVLSYAKKTFSVLENYPHEIESILVLGGGAHTMPSILSHRYPNAQITVVEIDRELDNIAREYFGFVDKDNISVIYEDARTFLNKNTQTFQVIIADTYSSTTIPFHMTTKETTHLLYDSLSNNGILIANVVSKLPEGILPHFLVTLKERFATLVFSTNPVISEKRSNFIVVAAKKPVDYLASVSNRVDDIHTGAVLTDDFAPVEQISY